MRVERLQLRDFRSYESAAVTLGPGLTVIHGPNGAGKTNLLEALYFGCTARSCRTTNERELVRFGAAAARVVVDGSDRDGDHQLTVGFEPGEPKRITADGAPVQRLLDAPHRPLVCVFLPDRLELVKGPPGLRRAHLDQVVAGLWPARSATRRAYAQALAQRNALISRVRSGACGRDAVAAWDLELATHGIALRDDRAAATAAVAASFERHAAALGLQRAGRRSPTGRGRVPCRRGAAGGRARRAPSAGPRPRLHRARASPRRPAAAQPRAASCGRTGHRVSSASRCSSLLLAERDALAAAERTVRRSMLLDDVMSELDGDRRERLADELRNGGQAIITTTDLDHVPGARGGGVARVAVADGAVLCEAVAA